MPQRAGEGGVKHGHPHIFGDCRCFFCGHINTVHTCNNRKRDKCPCGARHFFRRVRQGGRVVGEEEGWRKNGKEIVRC